MDNSLRKLPVADRIRLVEDLWDSIAQDQHSLDLTAEQKIELDRRLENYKRNPHAVRPAADAIKDLHKRL